MAERVFSCVFILLATSVNSNVLQDFHATVGGSANLSCTASPHHLQDLNFNGICVEFGAPANYHDSDRVQCWEKRTKRIHCSRGGAYHDICIQNMNNTRVTPNGVEFWISSIPRSMNGTRMTCRGHYRGLNNSDFVIKEVVLRLREAKPTDTPTPKITRKVTNSTYSTQVSEDPTTQSRESPHTNPEGESKEDSKSSTIIGLAVGLSLAALCTIAIWYYWHKLISLPEKCRRRRQATEELSIYDANRNL